MLELRYLTLQLKSTYALKQWVPVVDLLLRNVLNGRSCLAPCSQIQRRNAREIRQTLWNWTAWSVQLRSPSEFSQAFLVELDTTLPCMQKTNLSYSSHCSGRKAAFTSLPSVNGCLSYKARKGVNTR